MEDKIREATKLLRENGYVVKKMTETMVKDSNDCETSGFEKDCFGCSCSVCVVQ